MAEIAEQNVEAVHAASHPIPSAPRGHYLLTLSLAALGVVYGDIGTSPLYAMRECFHGAHAIEPSPANILGVLSLIFWSLILVISIKYLVFVMQADNRGEGGILALTSLATRMQGALHGRKWALIALGLFGAALLYGDGMITPAISVLSAVEGLHVATTFFDSYVIPITVAILVGLFLIQSHGTAGVGKVFGPVTFLWFVTIAALGITQIAAHPSVISAVNPLHAVDFFLRNGWTGYFILGTVVLVITGGESLYVDLGHFGRRPIRLVWFTIVLPALLLNYFGQGALLIADPATRENPFYLLAPQWMLYPLVVLATCATVIASQAVISGAFSITRQAVQLGFLPRLTITHTSSTEVGQIYIPGVNWALMLACILLVVGFRSSSNLAAAYGIAVITTMTITSVMFSVVARKRWGWSWWAVGALASLFLTIDLSFFGANIVKVADGGWFPLVVAGIIFLLMTTWKEGRRLLAEKLRAQSVRFADFLQDLKTHSPVRVPGTVVFMYSDRNGVPPALLKNIKHNKVLHERVIILTVVTEEIPRVAAADRVATEQLGEGFYRIAVRYGFMDDPDIPKALEEAAQQGLDYKPAELTYFLGRETIIANPHEGMPAWRDNLFAFMARNARRATIYFCIPPDQVIEVGSQVKL
ncbi:MAG: potassium transporter Kup [Pyrinomonadaceae bacterium]|nr:potassium transporter Kup [Pyrinomonadaceae bacterium]